MKVPIFVTVCPTESINLGGEDMKKTWEVMHAGHSIRVENNWFGGEKLFVDGILQDQQIGIRSSSKLINMKI